MQLVFRAVLSAMLRVTVFLLAIAATRALPGGPPIQACDTFRPIPQSAHGGNEQTTDTPYMVMLGGFPTENGTVFYTPGETHMCMYL